MPIFRGRARRSATTLRFRSRRESGERSSGCSNRPPTNPIIGKAEAPHVAGLPDVAPVEKDRLGHRSADAREVGAPELVPFRKERERIGPGDAIVIVVAILDFV